MIPNLENELRIELIDEVIPLGVSYQTFNFFQDDKYPDKYTLSGRDTLIFNLKTSGTIPTGSTMAISYYSHNLGLIGTQTVTLGEITSAAYSRTEINTDYSKDADYFFMDMNLNEGVADNTVNFEVILKKKIDNDSELLTGGTENGIIYMDSNRTDSYTEDGSIITPFKTPATLIAALTADFNALSDKQLSTYTANVAKGTYNWTGVTIPTYKSLKFVGNGVLFTGNFTMAQSPIGGTAPESYTRVEFKGMEGFRAEKGYAFRITGNVTCTRTNDSLTYLSLNGVYTSGNWLFDVDGTWDVQARNSYISGAWTTGTFASAASAVLFESDGYTRCANTFTGKFSLYKCNNTEFSGAINITPVFESKMNNCSFSSTVSIVPASSKNLSVDDITLKSLIDRSATLTNSAVVNLENNNRYDYVTTYGVNASYTNTPDTVSTSITITADNAGVAGDVLVATGNGVKTLTTLISEWNVANPANTVTLTAGDGTQRIKNAETITLAGGVDGVASEFTGNVPTTGTTITVDADVAGVAGNITLTADSTNTITALIATWNAAHPANTVTLTTGDGTQIPDTDIILAGGADAVKGTYTGGIAIDLEADTAGVAGNVTIEFDGIIDVDAGVLVWNTANPGNTVTVNGGGTEVPAGDISLTGGLDALFGTVTVIPSVIDTALVITAIATGAAGDGVLIGDGVSTVNALIIAYNLVLGNIDVTLSSGNGTRIPSNLENMALTGGVDEVFSTITDTPDTVTPVVLNAVVGGTVGNVTITGNGTSTISALITAWNVAHATNTLTLSGTETTDRIIKNLFDMTLTGGLGAAYVAGEVGYLDYAASAVMKKAKSDSLTTCYSQKYYCFQAQNANESKLQLRSGEVAGTGFTLGYGYISSSAAGALQSAAPSTIGHYPVPVVEYIKTTLLLFNGGIKPVVSGDLISPLAIPPAIGGTTPAAGTFTTVTANGIYDRIGVTAGEELAAGSFAYLAADETYYGTDADAYVSTGGFVVYIPTLIASAGTGLGYKEYDIVAVGATPAQRYWLSATKGAYTTTEPTTAGQFSRVCARATSATNIHVKLEETIGY